ncbi:hypothetical protein DIBJMFBN_00001 [Mannheimia haemolytica]
MLESSLFSFLLFSASLSLFTVSVGAFGLLPSVTLSLLSLSLSLGLGLLLSFSLFSIGLGTILSGCTDELSIFSVAGGVYSLSFLLGLFVSASGFTGSFALAGLSG